MKIIGLIFCAIVVGTIAGFGTTWAKFARYDEIFAASSATARPKANADKSGSIGPRVEVIGGTDYDFGTMARYAEQSHTFEIKNTGDELLKLTPGEPTCRCTIVNFDKTELKPVEIARMTLSWKATTSSAQPDFRQEAPITTNDPNMQVVRIVVHGFINTTVRAMPETVALSNVTASEGGVTQFGVFAYKDENLAITETSFEEEETADKFTVEFVPMTTEEFSRERGAKSGLIVTLTAKPGLPLGQIRQFALLATNLEESPVVRVPIVGSVIGDISVLGGRNFSRHENVLSLGTLRRGEQNSTKLHILVKGAHRNETKLTVKSIDPDDSLTASISEPKEINDGAVMMYTLTVDIREDARAVNRLGSEQAALGKIYIETTHPDAKQLQIAVRFAVE